MAGTQELTVDLGDDGMLVVLAEGQEAELIADARLAAKLTDLTRPIEHVGRELLDAVKRVAPSKATVEIGFGLAVEQGQLVALLGKGRGEATIKVVLEWSGSSAGGS